MSFLALLLSALGLGAAHALEPDHMAAVSAFVAQKPKPKAALWFGLKWAMGHGLSLLLLGSVLWAAKRAVEAQQPVLFSSGALEKVVGATLVALAAWTLWQVVSGRAAAHHHHHHEHAEGNEKHTHEHGERGFGSLWMGILHGAAGTGAFVGQSAVALAGSYFAVVLYTLLFSIGVLLAMGAYALVLGGVIAWSGHKSAALSYGMRLATGALTGVIGICLLLGVELPGLIPVGH